MADSPPSDRQLAAELEAVCRVVADAGYKLDEFWSVLPDIENTAPVFRMIRDDCEDAVEHAPGLLLGGGIDQEAWERSELRRKVIFDAELLAQVGRGMTTEEALAEHTRR